ncbi:MAG: LuxR C-terminal-related transcriptional regulator [Proteobacteria bacterium]|nr:LuxR C-terminal-related transcriptional regulator [Pseudomonadota bacterium]
MQSEKPLIPAELMERWQKIVDILATVMTVPAGLVMRAEPPHHVVLVSSASVGNPYVPRQSFVLNTGLYCDKVMDERCELLVRDALVDPAWSSNPDLEHSMSYYLGFPLCWPDGSIFGTVCVLDSRDNERATAYRALLDEFRHVMERDLALLVESAERQRLTEELRRSHAELEAKVAARTHELSETNTALRVLLNQVEDSRRETEEQVAFNLSELVLPQLDKLKRLATTPDLKACAGLIEQSIRQITSQYARTLSTKFAELTAAEVEIALLVMQGLNTKEIARAISRATSTVDFHRNNIRKKLGIEDRHLNLRAYLTSSQTMGISPMASPETPHMGRLGRS